MDKKKRVLITGMGVVSAAGTGKAESLRLLASGLRNPASPTLFDSPLDKPAFEVQGLPHDYRLEGQRTLGLALLAADEAAAEAGLDSESLKGVRVGVCMGTTVASQLNDIEFYSRFRESGDPSLEPVERFLDGDLSECIAKRFSLEGPLMTVVNACSSSTDAVGVALSWLRSGLCDIAIAGGADELNRVPYSGFSSLGTMSPMVCAPFDRDRNGLNLGEGAGVLVLETGESAMRRGISSNLFVAGFGASADAYHLTAPHPEGRGLRRAVELALGEAGITPSEVAFVNAHGTATPDNDRVEGRTLLDIFGPDVKVASTKGYTGHTLGAAGGVEAVFSALALREGAAPPNAGYEIMDEDIGLLPLVENTPVKGKYVLSTSLAFGGNNAALILGKEG
jgi:3-oxoacyl-(acyl-carrier-protein) synthase